MNTLSIATPSCPIRPNQHLTHPDVRESNTMFRFPWRSFARSTHNSIKRQYRASRRLCLETLEDRSVPTIYMPTGVQVQPAIEGNAFAGALVGTFASTDALGGLSATIDWGPTATPTSSIGTINLIGSVFVPGVGAVPQYSVTGGTTLPQAGVGPTPVTVTVSDAADATNGIIVSSIQTLNAPLTTTGGIASASVTEGARVNFTGAIAR